MTGPEHYREAERLLSDGCMQLLANKAMMESAIAEAQVHATLALAWATDPLVGHDDE